jgi:PTS system glucose-specific IIA component
MFGFFNKKSSVCAPFDGQVIKLEEVPDEAFAKKIVGDGLAIMPESNKLIAPFDGKIEQIFDTKHAFILKSSDGLQILIHVGINTVKLNGEGFDVKIPEKQELKQGDIVAEINFDLILEKKYSICTPIIFMNLDEFKVDFKFGRVQAGKDIIATYKKN